MIFARPDPWIGTETVNDKDGFVANFWRAVQHDPAAVEVDADNPVNENDLHARHAWLKERSVKLVAKLEGDPEYCDPKIAGWWCWGLCCWIGSGWCAPKADGPWGVRLIDGMCELVHLGNAGRGVKRQRVHLGNAGAKASTANWSTSAMPAKASTANWSTSAMPAEASTANGASWSPTSRRSPSGSSLCGCARATGNGSADHASPPITA